MQRPVTVSRTCGNSARQSRSSSSPNGTSTPSLAPASRLAEVVDLRERRRVGRGRRRLAPGETQRAAEGEAHAGGEPLVPLRRLRQHERAPHELEATAGGELEAHARELGLRPAPRSRAAPRAAARGGGPSRAGGPPRARPARARPSRLAPRRAPRRAAPGRARRWRGPGGARRRSARARAPAGSRATARATAPGRAGRRRGARAGAAGPRPRAAPRSWPRPSRRRAQRPSRSSGIEPRRRHDAPVQLEDPVPFGVAEGPGVVAARHLGESRLDERPDPVRRSARARAGRRPTSGGPLRRRTPSRRARRP